MKIEIKLPQDKSIYLESDANNFILHDGERIGKKGETMKINAKYYGDIKSAIEGIYTHSLLKSEATELRLLRNELDSITTQIKEIY